MLPQKNLRWHPVRIWVPFKSLLRVQIKRVIEWVANHYWHQKIPGMDTEHIFFSFFFQIKREKHMHIILFKRQLYLGTYFRPTRDLSIQTVSIWLAMVKFGRQLIFSGQPTAVHYGNMNFQVSKGGMQNQIDFRAKIIVLRGTVRPRSTLSLCPRKT